MQSFVLGRIDELAGHIMRIDELKQQKIRYPIAAQTGIFDDELQVIKDKMRRITMDFERRKVSFEFGIGGFTPLTSK